MLNSMTIKYGTAMGYVSGVVDWHKEMLGGLGSPLAGVIDWSRFTTACMVQSFVDASVESHLMVPFSLLTQTLLVLDRNNRCDVTLGLMMLMMYYTMSRSETPLPKTLQGFDPMVHLRRRDVRLGSQGNNYMEWGLGRIKNSTSKEKASKDPNIRHWKPVGFCTGILDIKYWLDLYMASSTWKSMEDPFFYDGGTGQILTYPYMLNYMRSAMARVPGMSWDSAKVYGFHGLRVLGFNCARAAAGEDVAILQGGWHSQAWTAYTREQLLAIIRSAQAGANYAASEGLPPMPMDHLPVHPGALPPDSARMPQAAGTSTHSEPGPAGSGPQGANPDPTSEAESSESEDGVPKSVVLSRRTTPKGRTYNIWTWRGTSYDSLKRLKAAYQLSKARKFFDTLATYGYTCLGRHPN
jgi:hypothetical protein